MYEQVGPAVPVRSAVQSLQKYMLGAQSKGHTLMTTAASVSKLSRLRHLSVALAVVGLVLSGEYFFRHYVLFLGFGLSAKYLGAICGRLAALGKRRVTHGCQHISKLDDAHGHGANHQPGLRPRLTTALSTRRSAPARVAVEPSVEAARTLVATINAVLTQAAVTAPL